MVDPVETGALVAQALGAGAGALTKGMLGEVAKDAYGRLKTRVARWAARDVEQVEAKPDSAARGAVIAEIVEECPEGEKRELAALAQAMLAALADEGKAPARTQFVIATTGGQAAGRDQNFYYGVSAPPPRGDG